MSETVPRGSMDFRYHRTHSLGLTFFPSNIWKWELLSYGPAAPLRRGLPICACLGRRLPCTAGAGVENAQMPPRGPRCFLDIEKVARLGNARSLLSFLSCANCRSEAYQ